MTPPVLIHYDIGNGVTAFSTTRRGGVSEGNYGTFNINPYCGDDEAAVAENRRLLAEELGIGADSIVLPRQTHGAELRLIGSEFFTLGSGVREMLLDGVDGVLTSLPGVCIGVSTADCIPVLLYDAAHKACCAVHAGWRGTVQRVAMKAVAEMRAAFGTDPARLRAVIGPGISEANFEVGQEVYDQFAEAGFDMAQIAARHDKWHINLPECNRLQLMQAGVSPDNIQQSGVCTYSHCDEYFSARRLGSASGRIFTAIMLR